VLADPFWKNQVVQYHVLGDGSVEMVPRVGGHIIYLGQPTNVTKKLSRLQKFYRYGLMQAGWNKYSRVSVEFDNQIGCKRK
jgi:cell division protein FtsQ